MRLTQVAQRAEDLTRATAFYTMLLGSRPVASFGPPGLVFFDLDGTRLLLDAAAPPSLLYLGVPDVRGRVEELRSAAVRIMTEPHVIFHHDNGTLGPAGTDEWMAFLLDSEGNTVGLISHNPPDA